MQVLRMLNGYAYTNTATNNSNLSSRILSRKKESHKRNLHFHVPVAIPCHPSMRLLQNDSSYITFGDIYEQFCVENGLVREDPFYMIAEKVKAATIAYKQAHGTYVRTAVTIKIS